MSRASQPQFARTNRLRKCPPRLASLVVTARKGAARAGTLQAISAWSTVLVRPPRARKIHLGHFPRTKVRVMSARLASRSERTTKRPKLNRRKIRPNKLASLRGDFKQAVFLDKALWQYFGSEERVLEVPRMLVSLAERTQLAVGCLERALSSSPRLPSICG